MKFRLNFFKNQFSAPGDHIKKGSIFPIVSGIILLFLLSYTLYIPHQKSIEDSRLSVGDIIQDDIVIRDDLTIIDEDQTEQKRKSALEEVLPVYQFLPDQKKTRSELINRWIEYLRTSRKQYLRNKGSLESIKKHIEENFGISISGPDISMILRTNLHSKIDLDQFLDFLDKIERSGVVSSKAVTRKSKEGNIKIVLRSGISKIQNFPDLLDLNELQEKLKNYFQYDRNFNSKESGIIASILIEFINVNLTFSQNLTLEEEKLITSKINPVVINLKKGRVILRKGDEIKNEDLRIIKLIYEEERERGRKLPVFFLIFFTLGPILFFVIKLLISWESYSVNGKKLISISLITLLVSTIFYRIFLFIIPVILSEISINPGIKGSIIYYSIPFTLGPLIIAFIFNIQSSVIFSFVNAITGSILCGWDLKLSLYILIGSLIVSFGIEYYQRLKRSPILKVSILWLFPFNLLFLILYNFTATTSDPFQIIVFAGIAAFSSISAPVLASFIIPLWEMLFNLLTELKLVELTNLNLPIFREMLEKAPGTYHHSQMVSSLSEAAALDLELSPLLLNAMALYHDIGKIDNPQVFTENHAIYENPHENLTPKESARNIISHIHNGLERAKELKLAESISSAISQHHGSKLVRFFYEKAVSASSGNQEEVDSGFFRYPGEKPKNIENA
ncbi:MAG: HDIG domain-containing metalloprotein [Acidobacteriota bacterium]